LEKRKGDGMGGCFAAPLEELVAMVKKPSATQMQNQFPNGQNFKVSTLYTQSLSCKVFQNQI